MRLHEEFKEYEELWATEDEALAESLDPSVPQYLWYPCDKEKYSEVKNKGIYLPRSQSLS